MASYKGISWLFAMSATALAAPTLEKRTSRTSAPSGCLSVQSGTTTSGWYTTLGAAVAALSGSDSACIFLYSGTYSEQVTIDYGGPLTSKPTQAWNSTFTSS
jgi:pectinesterase